MNSIMYDPTAHERFMEACRKSQINAELAIGCVSSDEIKSQGKTDVVRAKHRPLDRTGDGVFQNPIPPRFHEDFARIFGEKK